MRGFARFLRRNTVALLALFVALSGTTYAAATALAPNSVGTKQVINGSLQTKDLSKKTRVALKGKRGLRGLTGIPGLQGVKGDKGDKGDPGQGAIAWGYINADGTVSKASPNVSSSWDAGSKRYVIAISGESYFYSQYVTVVTPTETLIPHAGSVGGNLLVYFADTAGTLVQTTYGFQFVTYKP